MARTHARTHATRGSLSGTSLGPSPKKAPQFQQAMGDLDVGEVSVESLNPWSIFKAGIGAGVAAVTASSAAAALAAGDKITTTADGSGSISMSDFKNVGGVCKPMNFPALNFAKALQAQMNRVAQMKGWSKIGCDGAIGTGTMALFSKIKAAFPSTVMGDTSSCAYIAADCDVLAEQVRQVADSLNAPAKVSAPAAGPSTILTASGKTVIAPPVGAAAASAGDAFGGMSTTQKVVFAGLVGGIGYTLYKKSKKGKRR